MLCEMCKKEEATVHLTKVADEQVKKMHLCEACKEEMGIDTESPSSITDLFLGGGSGGDADDQPDLFEPVSGLVCATCEMTKLQFKKSGRLGCSDCYETFEEEMLPLVKAMHHSDRHSGKRPSRLSKKVVAEEELLRLQAELAVAVAQENFEDAAELRDQISQWKETLSAESGGEDE
jgi:protein arginine kinase activator